MKWLARIWNWLRGREYVPAKPLNEALAEGEVARIAADVIKRVQAEQDALLFGTDAAPGYEYGSPPLTNCAPEALTYEKLRQTVRDFEVGQDARDLDMFLSDDWPAYKILRDGGKILEVDGKRYAVAKDLLQSKAIYALPRQFPWGW